MNVARRIARLIVVLAVALSPILLLAAEALPTESDPVAAARAVALSEKLRCLVCQNQTIADSNADLAQDLRRQVREMLARGDDDAKIIQYMTDRYGDFVLYRPPMKATTMLLWFGPALMVVLGLAALAVVMRRRARAGAAQFEPDDPALFTDTHQS